jgi:hypothetical protein
MGNPERAVKTRSKAPNSWKKSRRLRMPRTFVHPTERMDLTDAFDDGPPPAYNIDDTYAKFGKDIGPTAVSHKTAPIETVLVFGPFSKKVTTSIKPRSIWRRLLDWWERP